MAKKITPTKPKVTPAPDPIAELIMDIVGNIPTPTSSALDIAAELIPGRKETNATDLLDSPELKNFRKAYVEGRIESDVINQVIGIVRGLLVARGLLPA